MARVLKDINVGIAMMVGVTSGYYVYEPLIRQHEIRRRAVQDELEAISEAVGEPVDALQSDIVPNHVNAPWTRWLLYRQW
jgi:hypothetical protein